MPKQVLFIQGGGEGARVVDAELVHSLQRALGTAYEVRYPTMPDEDAPNYTSWKRCVADEMDSLGDGIVVAAHSIGAGLLINLDLYLRAIPQARIRRLDGRDHQLNNDLSEVADDIRSLDEVPR